MKKSLLLALLAGTGFGAFAQNYYYFKTTGIPNDGYTSTPPTSATAVITGTGTAQANTLSPAQTFPFGDWTLYGFNASQFKVSTSGYITFDPNQTTDNTSNEALPSATAPKMSIFAFWDNTRIQSLTQGSTTYASDVKSWTYGTAPKRTFVVQWRLVQTNDGSNGTNVTYYAVLFREAGGFDIIHNYGFGTFTATTGVQDLTAAHGTQVTGSPNMNFGGKNGSNDPKASAVYHFIYGTQPALDVKLKLNQTAGIVSTSSSAGASIKIVTDNYGSATMNGAKMNYSIDGGATVTAPITASIAGSGGSATITHPTAFVPVTADAGTSKTVKVWLTEINGTTDLSDTITFNLFVNKGISGTKKVFVEEGSGAWCGYCPDGHYRLKDIMTTGAGNVIAAVHHNADAMTNTESNTLNTTYATGYPYGMVDRMKFDDQDEVGMSRSDWAAKVAIQLNRPTPVNVSIVNKNFDWAAGKVTYDVKVDFVDFARPGDLRINTMVVEDKVRGPQISATSMQWNQRNYYSYEAGNQAGGSSHPLFSEPAYIQGYNHNEVVRNIPSGAWGTASVITNAAPGQSFTQSYSHTMTKANYITFADSTSDNTEFRSTKNGRGWNKFEDTRIIAFVSYYDADVNKREVLNVTEADMITTGVNELPSNQISNISVYPNPANGLSAITFNLNTTSNVTVDIVNLLGQKVSTVASGNYAGGSHAVYFNTADLQNGVYFVNINATEGAATYKFVVSK